MSKEKEIRNALAKEATDAALTSKFIQDIGQKAQVERVSVTDNPQANQLREVLAEIGENLQEVGIAPKGMTYRGTLSVQIYTAATLNMAAFVVHNNLGTLDGSLADGALRELTGGTMQVFGKRMQKLRSGF